MPVSADTLAILMEAGLQGDMLLRAVRSIDADMASSRPERDPVADRRRAYDRQRKRDAASVSQSIPAEIPPENSTGIPPEKAPPLPPQRDINQTPSSPPKKLVRPNLKREAEIAFENQFWAIFPRRVGKDTARKVFIGKVLSERGTIAEIIDGAIRLRDEVKNSDPKFIPHPATWLNRGGWEDELPGMAKHRANGSNDPPRVDFGGGVVWPEAQVKIYVEHFRLDPSSWPRDRLGAPPGHHGCKVPPRLLEAA